MSTALNTTELRVRTSASTVDLTDEDLLLRYRETGQREYFAELVSRYEQELFSFLKRQLGSAEAAEDAFQAAFLQVHLKADLFAADRRFRPWLYAIATNQMIDMQRRQRRQRTVSLDRLQAGDGDSTQSRAADWLVSDEPAPGDRADHREHRELLKRAMSELTDQMRMVIHLVYYQGLKYREAAEVMSVPVGTVKSRLHAAIAKLTEFWNTQHSESD